MSLQKVRCTEIQQAYSYHASQVKYIVIAPEQNDQLPIYRRHFQIHFLEIFVFQGQCMYHRSQIIQPSAESWIYLKQRFHCDWSNRTTIVFILAAQETWWQWLLSQLYLFRDFANLSALSKYNLAIKYHVDIWLASPQLSCGDRCEIWVWLKKKLTSIFAKSKILLSLKSTNGALVTTTPEWIGGEIT